MKKAITIIILLFSLVFSNCKKENEQVLVKVLNPSVEVTSVDSLIYHQSGCGYVPFPSDSTASISLDINNDGVVDYILTCKTWSNFVSASSPCANYNTSIVISGTSDDNQIAITGNYNAVNLFELDNVVDNSQEWSRYGTLMLSSAQAPFSYNFNGNKYLGIRATQGQGDNFGWIYFNKDGYKITIMSYAINQTVDNSIKAGQIE